MPWWLWVVSGIALAAAETRITRDFTLLCVGISAILVGVISALEIFPIWGQWLAFALLSGATLFWARDWLRSHLLRTAEHRELSNVLGEVAIPVDDVPPYGFGKAELRGTRWNAHNASHVALSRGQRCRVMKIKGLTLWIMPE
jgi:membrane protein implicated in regulation of membrane protease activity